MLRRLKIHRYRNVAPGTELHFDRRHHVLLGPNGGGKTTLLKLISVVLRGDFDELGDETYDVEYEFEYDDVRFAMRVARPREHDAEPGRSTWRVDATMFRADALLGRLTATERETRMDDRVTSSPTLARLDALHWRVFFEIPDARYRADWMLNLRLATSAAHRFDEALDFFRHLQGQASESVVELLRVKLYRALQGGKWMVHAWGTEGRIGEAAGEVWKRAFERADDPDRLQLALSDLGLLGEVVDLLGMKHGVWRADLGRHDREGDSERFVYDRFQFRFTRRDGTHVLDEHLSFGQKRLLAFFVYVWANEGPVVADELVDGMHHRWIRRCLDAIGDRQAFLSSQSPLLMDFFGFTSADDVRRCFVLCDLDVQGDREHMRWRTMDADEAALFFDAYAVGIQHVSEILRDRGLW